MSREALDDLIDQHPRDAVIELLFIRACDKVNFRPSEMTEGDVIVYTIWTFLGETCNGGIIQYLTNPSGKWAHRCGASLRQVGGSDYADIVEDCIRAFTDAESAEDPQWESDLDAYWDDDDEPFEDIESRFWNMYNADNDQIPDMLYKFICDNRELFALSSSGM